MHDNGRRYYHSLREVSPKFDTFFDIYIHKIAKKFWETPYYTKEWKQLEKFPLWKMMKNHKFTVFYEWKWELISWYENAKEWKIRYVTRSNKKIEWIELMNVREIFKKTPIDMWITNFSQIWNVEMLEYKESCGDFWWNWTETHYKYKVDWKFISEWIND